MTQGLWQGFWTSWELKGGVDLRHSAAAPLSVPSNRAGYGRAAA
jgi:hypothetical protein